MVDSIPMRRSSKRTVGLVLSMTVYLVIGATVFSLLEKPGEVLDRKTLRESRLFFLEWNPCVIGTFQT